MASGGLVSGLTSYARNTKPVYDANGQFSMLVTAWGTVGTDAGKGALSAGASNLVLTYLPPAINTGLDWLDNKVKSEIDLIEDTDKLKMDLQLFASKRDIKQIESVAKQFKMTSEER